MRHLATISAFWMVALISNANAIDVDLQNYRCSQFLADTKDPSDGAKLLKSLMMISWSTGYAAAYQGQKPRSDPAALRLMAATLGMNCAKAPDRNATDVLADLVKQFTADASAQPTPQSNEIVPQPTARHTSTAATRIDRRSGKSFIGPSLNGSVSSVDECEDACRGEAKCAGYTFLTSQKQCKLFARIGNFASDSSAISGVKTQSAR